MPDVNSGQVTTDILGELRQVVTGVASLVAGGGGGGGGVSTITINGTPSVNVANIPAVTVSGTPSFNVANTPSVLVGNDVVAIGRMLSAVATFARPSDTNGYAALDGVSQSTNAATATVLSFPSLVMTPGANGYLVKAMLFTDVATVTARHRLYLFSSAVTPIADNAAFAEFWANRSARIGYVDFDAPVAGGTGSDLAMSQNVTLRLPFSTSSNTTTVFGMLRTTDAFTPVSAQNYHIRLTSDPN